jgi:nicotinamidase-related amidase
MAEEKGDTHHQAIIGNADNFWLYSSQTGFDLTHPSHPSSPAIEPRLTMPTDSKPVTIDPAKSALVIIDMQNFFLSPAFGRNTQGAGHQALKQLVDHAIPAARKSSIRILWVNWGLTDHEVETMPPAVKRAFGFEAVVADSGEVKATIKDGGEGSNSDAVFKERDAGFGVDKEGNPRPQGGDVVLENGKNGKIYKGLGGWCGMLEDPSTGNEIDAGRLLVRESWNAGLCPPLDRIYAEGSQLTSGKPDVWIHKNRMSGLWGSGSELEGYLEKEGIRTLLFTGVNTDQCVGGTLQDAFSKGYDCVLLNDGAGTTSPDYAQQCMEFNAGKTWGFVTKCKDFADGVEKMM